MYMYMYIIIQYCVISMMWFLYWVILSVDVIIFQYYTETSNKGPYEKGTTSLQRTLPISLMQYIFNLWKEDSLSTMEWMVLKSPLLEGSTVYYKCIYNSFNNVCEWIYYFWNVYVTAIEVLLVWSIMKYLQRGKKFLLTGSHF